MSKAPVTERIQKLFYSARANEDWNEIPRRDAVYRRVTAGLPECCAALRLAKCWEAFLREKRILILPDDLLAGYHFRYTYESSFPTVTPDAGGQMFRLAGTVDPSRVTSAYIKRSGKSETNPEAAKLRAFENDVRSELYKHYFSGHTIPDYPALLRKGFNGLLEECEYSIGQQTDPDKKEYLEAVRICLNAAKAYILRYAVLASDLKGKMPDPDKAAAMERIENACRHIAGGVPHSFFEAVQLIWLTHEMLFAESVPYSFSFGRMDMYLDPYYRKDLAAGILTKAGAYEILEALWIKFSATIQSYQNITLGGEALDGSYFCSDLTAMMMEVSETMRFDQPNLSLRCRPDMPDHLWNTALNLICTGTGFPAFHNDAAIIRTKLSKGMTEADARNYAIMGCVEINCPGKEYSNAEIFRMNMPKILELMLSGGEHLVTGARTELKCCRDLDKIQSFEEFYEWYKDEYLYALEKGISNVLLIESFAGREWPSPFLSALMDGCIEKGIDVMDGGTVYNNTGISLCGQAVAVDSLLAIRWAVFEQKLLTLSELADVLKNDYRDHEPLRRMLASRPPAYGVDHPDADLMMKELVDLANDYIRPLRNPRGGFLQLGLYSVEDHSTMGSKTGATPNGRHAKTALSSSHSPVQGRDTEGPTAVINSVLATDFSEVANNMVLDLKFSPQFLNKEEHRRLLRILIENYFSRGGMEIQFNVVDRETLLDAQAHPENHANLVVRVSGFSAYYTQLSRTTQDEILARTEHGTI